MSSNDPNYQKGYDAGRRWAEKAIRRLEIQVDRLEQNSQQSKHERAYYQCLDLALKHCSGWTIGGEKINNSEGYCKLADVLARNAIGNY